MKLKDMSMIEWMIIGVIVLILAVVAVGAPARMAEQESFMADCMRQEPQYQCQVKWKQIHPDPVVVFAPLNR